MKTWVREKLNSFTGRRVIRWILAGSPWVLQRREIVRRLGLNEYAAMCHQASVNGGWWHDVNTGEPLKRNHGELLMLMVSELAEAMEGIRKNLDDDKLPHRKMVEVEMADALIRIFDYAGASEAHGQPLDIEGALCEKMAFNAQRADHKPENRRAAGGKAF